MICALTVGGIWQIIASYLELNVSATHSISERAGRPRRSNLPPGPLPATSTAPRPLPTRPPPPRAVGAIIGFSLVYGGKDAVNWATPAPNLFPPYSGVVPIVSAWLFAPVATALAAAIIVFLMRTFVLRRPNPAKWSLAVLPVSVFLTSWVSCRVTRRWFRGGQRLSGHCYVPARALGWAR